MRNWIHKLSNINAELKEADCAECGRVKIRLKSPGLGRPSLWKCRNALRKWNGRKVKYRIDVSLICSRCGFVAKHECQIDKHHIDGNHDNNSPENLENICANCHRLETTLQSLK